LITNIRLGCKWLRATNSPAYYSTPLKLPDSSITHNNWTRMEIADSYKFTSLLANIRLGWKWLIVTNALAYFDSLVN